MLKGQAKKLSVYIGEADRYEDKPLYEALVEQARIAGCAGATVLRGVAGFGATSREHVKHGIRMSVDLPLMVHVIDVPDKITALAEVYGEMVGDGLIVVEDVSVIMYRGGMTGGPEAH
ncbi:MAG: DUF190 domain-containing protein [Coriobacteriia bacterium]|jgi:hypothetical protein|nr:DUF190 domain-containing protein [Coriobacteriia bacterium]